MPARRKKRTKCSHPGWKSGTIRLSKKTFVLLESKARESGTCWHVVLNNLLTDYFNGQSLLDKISSLGKNE